MPGRSHEAANRKLFNEKVLRTFLLAAGPGRLRPLCAGGLCQDDNLSHLARGRFPAAGPIRLMRALTGRFGGVAGPQRRKARCRAVVSLAGYRPALHLQGSHYGICPGKQERCATRNIVPSRPLVVCYYLDD